MAQQTKFVFVTGGVVSSLGKGMVSASIGALMENRGLKVANMKLDPYINVDPGTMNPTQHGEVFVTDDGAETDLDLGHYERFVSTKMSRLNNITTGPDLLDGDRQGAPRRVPRLDGPGDPAHHRRDQGAHPALRRGPRRPRRRGRRHGRRHRVAAVPRGGAPAARRARHAELGQRAPDAGAAHPRGRRVQDQADPALGAEAARDRHPVRRPRRALRAAARRGRRSRRWRCSATSRPTRCSSRSTSTPSTGCR